MVQKRSLPKDRNPLVEPEHTPQCKSVNVAISFLQSTILYVYNVSVEKQATNQKRLRLYSGNPSGAS